ncbi:MAG: membrane protein insertase YidC [Gemmatimonadota bacterium]|nr:membrane protein insertase YidC [Gemmatimonadota bacterium]
MDRRALWAILLMMAIAIVPSFLIERPAPEPAPSDTTAAAPGNRPERTAPAPADELVEPSRADTSGQAIATAPIDTIAVLSNLYRYDVSTLGGRIVGATLLTYPSMAASDSEAPAQIVLPGSDLLGLTLVSGRDTVPLANWRFTASDSALDVTAAATPLQLTAERGGRQVELTYTFVPNDYRIAVTGRVTGMGPAGGLLLVGMGQGLRNVEADSAEHLRELAIVTMQDGTERLDFGDLEPGQPETVSGPFAWVAIKSKYFVSAVFATDSADGRATGRIGGVRAVAPAGADDQPSRADVRLSIPVGADGVFRYTLYAGPMEYDRLAAMGNGFDDVNPYGWPGIRTLIHFFAVPVRWLLVWMHEHLGLAYGAVLVVFGIMVRIVLWPLNQKAMRSSMAMQAIQPEMKAIQERYKENPQKQQQEMMRLYKEHGVNPLGGCWPMLLPMPVLFALFFVFQNTIELRGADFLWVPDLSRPDPLYIIPLVMGLSMYVLTKVGQIGIEPNPQMKMMLYLMPAMMTFFLWRFAAGLNLYYAVSNIASIPQQWLVAKERQRRAARTIVEVKTNAPPGEIVGKHKRKR